MKANSKYKHINLINYRVWYNKGASWGGWWSFLKYYRLTREGGRIVTGGIIRRSVGTTTNGRRRGIEYIKWMILSTNFNFYYLTI